MKGKFAWNNMSLRSDLEAERLQNAVIHREGKIADCSISTTSTHCHQEVVVLDGTTLTECQVEAVVDWLGANDFAEVALTLWSSDDEVLRCWDTKSNCTEVIDTHYRLSVLQHHVGSQNASLRPTVWPSEKNDSLIS